MTDTMMQYLEAYHDGELNRDLTARMADHLAGCEACRGRLAALAEMRQLLLAAPMPDGISEDRFTAQVMLRLPRRQAESNSVQVKQWLWWLAPAGIIGFWALAQVLFFTTGVVQLAPLFINMDWITALPLGNPWEILLLSVLSSVICGLLFLSWLAAWWAGLTPSRGAPAASSINP